MTYIIGICLGIPLGMMFAIAFWRSYDRRWLELVIGSINDQLREHGIAMQFDPTAFYPKR